MLMKEGSLQQFHAPFLCTVLCSTALLCMVSRIRSPGINAGPNLITIVQAVFSPRICGNNRASSHTHDMGKCSLALVTFQIKKCSIILYKVSFF